jgi:hypothetical protein
MQIYDATAVEKVLQIQQHILKRGGLLFKSIVEEFLEVRTGAKDKNLQDFSLYVSITVKGSIAQNFSKF